MSGTTWEKIRGRTNCVTAFDDVKAVVDHSTGIRKRRSVNMYNQYLTRLARLNTYDPAKPWMYRHTNTVAMFGGIASYPQRMSIRATEERRQGVHTGIWNIVNIAQETR